MKSLVADTNIFLRFILKDIPVQYDETKKLFNDVKRGELELVVPQIVIFEVAFALTTFYRFSREKVMESLRSLIATHYFKIQDRDIFKGAIRIYLDHKISFVDSFLLAYASEKNVGLFTFDKRLKKIKLK